MRKVPLFICALFYLMIAIFSCKKEDPATSANSRQSLLQGKWNLLSITLTHPPYPGSFRYEGEPLDYFDFKNNDTLYTYVQDTYVNFKYKLLENDSTLVYNNGDTAVIRTLTDHLLVLHGHNSEGNGGDTGLDSLSR